ncbi:MAG: AcrR family transcriptional regulator [Ascidiaceihabitans sp.]|jgi:AcrR family transcriptional regulator
MDDRLSKTEWLEHGLKVLALGGFPSMKAAPLARSLNVSRGSFYWHFKDISAFRNEVLELWRVKTTVRVIDDLDNQHTPKERLKALIFRAGRAEFQLERAVRAWATQDSNATKMVESVDQERIQFIIELLRAERFPKQKAHDRALILYWAYLGKNMTAHSSDTTSDGSTFDEIFALIMC